MNRRTTINPRTKATAKTPKSATEKCEGSIFEKTKRPFLQQLIQNGGLVDGHCAMWRCSSPPVTQRIRANHGSREKQTPSLMIFFNNSFFFFFPAGGGCHPHVIYTNNGSNSQILRDDHPCLMPYPILGIEREISQ